MKLITVLVVPALCGLLVPAALVLAEVSSPLDRSACGRHVWPNYTGACLVPRNAATVKAVRPVIPLEQELPPSGPALTQPGKVPAVDEPRHLLSPAEIEPAQHQPMKVVIVYRNGNSAQYVVAE